MLEVYVIIRKSTGEVAHSRAVYTSLQAAKSVVRRMYCPQDYAVARIGSAATVVAEIDGNGRWRDTGW